MTQINPKWIQPASIDSSHIKSTDSFNFNGVICNDLLQVNDDATVTGNLHVTGVTSIASLTSDSTATNFKQVYVDTDTGRLFTM